MLLKMFPPPCVQSSQVFVSLGKSSNYKENICFYLLILWHLKQLLCSLTVTSPLILTCMGTFQLPFGTYSLSFRIAVSAGVLETWAYLLLFCAAIKRHFLSYPATALATMQNCKVKPEVIFATQFSYFLSHCIVQGSPLWSHVPP